MASVRKALFALRSIGLKAALRTSRYSAFRDRAERGYNQGWEALTPQPPGVRYRYEPIANGGRFRYHNASLEVIFLAPNLVRVSWDPGKPPLPYALAEVEWPGADVSVTKLAEGVSLSSSELTIEFRDDGTLIYTCPTGEVLRTEQPPEHVRRVVQGESEPEVRWTHRATLKPEERVYGLGERAAPFNLRGGAYRMWNSDPGGSYGPGKDPLYLGIPAYLGLHAQGSYLVFYENSFPATFTIADQPGPDQPAGTAEACFEGGMLRYYLAAGSPAQVTARYTELTGQAPLPPAWALGYHQCRWGYRTEADIRQVVEGFERHNLPLAAMHLDIDYMDGFRVFTVSKEGFPNLKGLAADLEQKGIRLVTILDPGVKADRDYSIYQQGMQKNAFCRLPNGKTLTALVWPGWSVFPDFTSPAVRQWWSEQYAFLLDQGVAGIWQDMNEPATFSAWGDSTLPLSTRHDLEGRGGDHREAHNVYGLLMNRAGYEGLRHLRPDRRPWLISRSGWAGIQRYAWNWTGDTETSWATLHQTIATVLSLGLLGIAYTGPDIGGFSGSPSAELYVRWFQLSSFLPFFRTHSAVGTDRREPWVFGEPSLSIVRKSLQLRYRLLPYIYTTAWENAQTGAPLIRPLFWPASDDQRLWDSTDAFLLGSALLVAPVTEAEATQKTLYLPEGDWFNFWDDSLCEGGQEVTLPAPLEQAPLLVRSGSILTLDEQGALTLHVYAKAGASAIGQLYSDAGDGYGSSSLHTFELQADGNGLLLEHRVEGDFPLSYARMSVVFHGLAPVKAWVDGQEAALVGSRLELDRFESLKVEL